MKSSWGLGLLAVSIAAACGVQPKGVAGNPAETPTDASAVPWAADASPADATAQGAKPGDGGPDADPAADAAVTYDPFAPQPDESQGLTNVSSDLQAILENGALAGACDSYNAGQTDPKTTLLCGKWEFFYETFGTSGMPASLVEFLATNFPTQLGLGFSQLGMIPDPTSTTNMPLGLATTVDLDGNIPAVAFTCAGCHFAQLPDGRYAVGAPHQGYDYARHILTISLVPGLAMGLSQPSDHDPAAVAEVQPVLDAISADGTLKAKLALKLLPLIAAKQPSLTTTVEHDYATWPTGTLDFLIAPLPIDDNVHIVGKMIGLWGIPEADEMAAVGMQSALLGWTGDAAGLDEFVNGFATLGGAASAPTPNQLAPILAYIYSLRAPSNPAPPDATQVTTGAALFQTKGCATCHGGPRGSGTQAYSFEQIGTDPTLAEWADPTLSGTTCCGVPSPVDGLTHGVKSPRLVGMWSLDRFLHNGALSSLEQLFCLGDAGVPPAGEEPLLTGGHSFTCSGLADDEKSALIAYLKAH